MPGWLLWTSVKVTEEVTHWFSFSFGLMTCGIWVPQLRIEPVPPAMEVQSPNPQTTRGVPTHWLSWRNPQFILTFTHVFFHKDDLVLFLFFFSPTQIISNALSIKRSSEVNKSHYPCQIWASQVALVVKKKKTRLRCRRHKRCGFNPWVRKIPWRRARWPTPAFLPGKSHGQRRLTGYSPWGYKQSAQLKQLSMHTCISVK